MAVAYGKYASCRLDAVIADNHRTVVKGRILEEDILDEALVDSSIYGVARLYDIVEGTVSLQHNQRAALVACHIDARHHDRH